MASMVMDAQKAVVKQGLDFYRISGLLMDGIPSGAKASRPWGIEVEVCGYDNPREYMTPFDWDSKDDGSLCGSGDGDYTCTCHEDGLWECEWEPSSNEILNRMTSLGYEDLNDDHDYDEYHDRAVDELLDEHECSPEEYYCYDCTWECSGYNDQSHGEGIEFVSPILRSIWDPGLEDLTSGLPDEGHECAGIHVHVDVSDLSVRQIASLAFGWVAVGQDLVAAAMYRGDVYYAAPWNHEDLNLVEYGVKDILRGHTHSEVEKRRFSGHFDRYRSLNLTAIRAHGTVEFRGMGPVYDYDHLTAWASICRGFVTLAASGMSRQAWLEITDTDSYLAMLKQRTGKWYA